MSGTSGAEGSPPAAIRHRSQHEQVISTADFICSTQALAQLSKEDFLKYLKTSKFIDVQYKNAAAKKIYLEFREAFGNVVKSTVKINESSTLIKRGVVHDIHDDIWLLLHAYVIGNASSVVHLFEAKPRTNAEKLADLVKSVNASGSNDTVLRQLLPIVIDLVNDSQVAKKQKVKVEEEMKDVQHKLVEATGEIFQLKAQIVELKKAGKEYSKFKYCEALDSSQATSKRQREDETAVEIISEELPNQRTQLEANSSTSNDLFIFGATDPSKDSVWQTAGKKVSYLRQDSAVVCPADDYSKSKWRNAAAKLFVPSAVAPVADVRSGRKSKYVVGQRGHFGNDTQSNKLKAAVRRFHFYVGNWLIGTSSDDVKQYVQKNVGPVLEIVQLECQHNRFVSFRVTVEDVLEHKMLNACSWPRNVRVKRFFFLKEKLGRKETEPAAAVSASNGMEAASAVSASNSPTTASENPPSDLTKLPSASNNLPSEPIDEANTKSTAKSNNVSVNAETSMTTEE
jgi:hypothetical protein